MLVGSAHMPVEIFGLQVKHERIGEQFTGNLVNSIAVEIRPDLPVGFTPPL